MNDDTIISEEAGTEYNQQAAPADVVAISKAGTDWQTKLVLAAAIGAGLWGLFAPLGAGWGLWGWKSGLTGVQWSFFLGVGGLLLGLLYIWRGKRTGKPRRPLLWLGTAIAAGYTGWMLSLLAGAASVPAIHDISTDLADPPQFIALTLRADNLDSIPGAEDSEMKGMSPTQRWTLLHQREYGGIRSVRINQPVNAVMAKAARLATDRGWEIAANLPTEGRLEATSTTALFRFKDDVVLRVRPTEDASGSIVDMRSVSRVGQSDLGVNAKRVQAFLADLSGTVTPTQ